MPRRFVDLSIYLENDVISDPEPFGPKIQYHKHENTAAQIAGLAATEVRSRFDSARIRERFAFTTEGAGESTRHNGAGYVDRFDANSYLYITKAMDIFDLAQGYHSLGAALEQAKARFLVMFVKDKDAPVLVPEAAATHP